jgi:hypothetical protein
MCRWFGVQEKTKVKASIILECKTKEGHEHFMTKSFNPWMKMSLSGDKAGKGAAL